MTTSSYETVFKKMDSLQGKDKQAFGKTLTKEEKNSYVNYCKERDCEMVTGIFRCFEPPGGMLEMNYKAYPGEDAEKKIFIDGQEYTVPRYVAKRFESDFQGSGTYYTTHSYIMDSTGKPLLNTNGKKTRRFGFSSMDFQ